MYMSIIIDVLINDDVWLDFDKKIQLYIQQQIKKIIPLTFLKSLLQDQVEIELSVVLTNNDQIQQLNKDYRAKDKSTNVLSFPTFTKQDIESKRALMDNFLALGDIVLAFETIQKEAKEQNKEFCDHLCHLLAHSILHLIGYDHMVEKEALEMENFEIAILKNLEIDNPYR